MGAHRPRPKEKRACRSRKRPGSSYHRPGLRRALRRKPPSSVGERVGDAYSDPQGVEQHPKSNTGRLTATGAASHNNGESNRFLSVGRKVTENLSRPLFEERFLRVVGGFALGYLTAVLLHGRINAYFDTRPGPFQITKPPQGNNIREASSSQQSQNHNRAPARHENNSSRNLRRMPDWYWRCRACLSNSPTRTVAIREISHSAQRLRHCCLL